MTNPRPGTKISALIPGLLAAAISLPSLAIAAGPQTVVLHDFEAGTGGAVAVSPSNSSALAASNSSLSTTMDFGSNRLLITDSDGGSNGALITIPGAIPGPGYYLYTADVKVDNATAPIPTYGMGVKDGAPSSAKISDINAGYVMNLTGSGDAALGYQTIGAAITVPNSGAFPRDLTIYFGTDVSNNTYNAPATDGDFTNTHRTNAAAWAAGSSNAVYIDNIKRIGPGHMGEERHLWISVGDAFTNLASLESYLVQAKANNFTAVDILARYRADAYYVPNRTDATYPNPEPFGSRVGTTTVSPQNDPLQYAIDRCRELDLKVYISFSSFLVSPNSTYPSFLPAGSIMGYNDATVGVRDMTSADNSNEGIWADLGRADVRAYTKNILMDIVTNYDIDGVVFDRIRYPGSRFGYNAQALTDLGYSSVPSPFSAAFRDSRRNVIGDFLAECYNDVTTAKPWVVFGATPIAFGTGMTDTYNNVFQHFPTWTSRKVSNRAVSFGCMDLIQPQFYRLASAAAPNTAPGANNILMQKLQYGDVAVDAKDFGLMPGAYSMAAPLLYHPSSPDAGQSLANAQNITDSRALAMSGFGLFAANRTLADIAQIRAASASTAGADVLAGTPTPVDYLFKSGYDNVVPNPVTVFNASPQSRGSVVFTWDAPGPAADGDTAAQYVIYKSTTLPVREIWANQVTRLPVKGNWFHAPVGTAGSYHYKIVALDDYNNRSTGTEIGPFTVAGVGAVPDDVIVDNPAATVVGAWTLGTSAVDKYGINYYSRGSGTGTNSVKFSASIPVTGNWTVSEWHNQGTNRAPDARHIITNDGASATVSANQQLNGGKWNALGQYSLTGGNTYSVTIDDVFTPATGRVVVADAIRWSYIPTPVVTPAQPANLVATPVSSSQINLTWQDVATNESGYELERTICGGSTIIISLPANTTSYSDSALAADTEYRYVVRAWATGTQSADSNKAAARTLPQLPDDIIIDNPQAVLFGAWTVASAAGQYGSNYLQGFASLVRTATFNFVPERDGVYEIYEWHIAGTNRTSAAPHIVNYASGGSETVLVNQKLSGGQWNKIGQWLFTGGTSQSVVISNAFNTATGSVVMADAIKVVYKAEPPTTPAAPGDLTATAISHTEVGLTWQDNAVNETSYEIERTRQGGQPEVVAALPADSVGYVDTGLDALTQYSYVVRAVNGQGSSANSNVATVTTLSSTPPDQIIDNLQADLVGAWSLASSSADKYATSYAFRSKTTTNANWASFNFVTRDTGLYEISEWHPAGTNRPLDAQHIVTHAQGSTSLLVNQRVNGGQWNPLGTFAFDGASTYSVRITDNFLTGDIIMADAVRVVWVGDLPTEPPVAPSGLTANGQGASQVNLSWTDNSSDEAHFEILRNGTVLTTVGANVTAYSDTAASECTTFTYTIRAVRYGVSSADSNPAEVSLDATAPVLAAPADITVSTDAGQAYASSVNLGSPSASDNCLGDVSVTSNAPATFALGQTLVTWTATDAAGNSATATQTVTVNDTEAPIITAPANVQVVAGITDCTAPAVNLGTPVTSDNAGDVTVTNNAPAIFPVGSTTVTWTATDAAGNSATATQTVTVVPNQVGFPLWTLALPNGWNSIKVQWDNVSNETGYDLYYSKDLLGSYTHAVTVAADVTQYVVTGLEPDQIYFFLIVPKNACTFSIGLPAIAKTDKFSALVENPTAASAQWGTGNGAGSIGGNYRIRDRRTTDDPAKWSATIPANGKYKLSVYIPNVSGLTTQAEYRVQNGTFNSTTIVAQRHNLGKWVTLGTYNLKAGALNLSVYQTSNSTNAVIADGLKIEQD